MSVRIISRLNKRFVVGWIVLIISAMIYVMYRDIFGGGLKETLIYSAIGYFAFPLFYGLCIFAVIKFTLLLRNAEDYMKISDDALFVGSRSFPLKDIERVYFHKNALLFDEIIIQPKDKDAIRIKSYVLSAPSSDVLNALDAVKQAES